MISKQKIGLYIFLILDAVLVVLCFLQVFHPIFGLEDFGLFNAKGPVAAAQARLIVTAFLLMLIIVIPVLTAGFFVAFKYRVGRNEDYDPEWGQKHGYLKFFMWAFPVLIIIFISILNFKSAHSLDPAQAISAGSPPLTIQVVALQWKWLFIYPGQNIATVNYIDIPQNVPLHFELTADAPMSLFWIPQLGGEMAAMQGMVTGINLMATQTGTFTGQNSEINGEGYARMKFTVNSTSRANFDAWVAGVKKNSPMLNEEEYNKLIPPSQNNAPAYYGSVDANLYNNVVMKFTAPSSAAASSVPAMYMK
ncbi:MAG: COX aromatic rich motif-containing protein [Candidatus Doudnabacteria bacterium]|nr:COX aromatic rich motif-containing protein [Candidatus Doudnabacteria bacterium]